MLLPSEDAEAYETHLLQYLEQFAPVGHRETELVQSLADTLWRLHHIPSLEFGWFALGRQCYAELFEEETDAQVRIALLDAHILITDAKHFQNLHRQESRLRRHYQQDRQELKQRQAQHQEVEASETKGKAVAPAQPHGFEFTTVMQPSPEERKEANCAEQNGSALVCTGSV